VALKRIKIDDENEVFILGVLAAGFPLIFVL
jgi:hypothetical protein